MRNDMFLSLDASMHFADLLRFAPETHDPSFLLKWTDANGVPLCFIDQGSLGTSLEQSDWLKTRELALQKLPQEKMTWFPEYCEIAEALSQQGIPICLIKTHGPFPFWSGNIDSIVLEKDLQDVVRILESIGLVRFPWCDEPHKLLFKRFEKGKTMISLHLHSRIVWDATFIYSEDAIRNNRLIDNEKKIRIINGGALIATILAHAFVENQSVRLIDLHVISEASKTNDRIWEDAARIAEKMEWKREFSLATQAFGEADRVLRKTKGTGLLDDSSQKISPEHRDPFAKLINKRISAATIFPISLPTLPTKGLLMKRIFARNDMPGFPTGLSRIWLFLKDFLIRELGNELVKGKIIAVSGPDGSGKTTIAKGIGDLMKEMGVNFDIYWSRYGTISLMQEAFGTGTRKTAQIYVGRKWKGLPKKGKMKLIENVARLEMKSVFTRVSGRSIIFDRHFLDTKIDHLIETEGGSPHLLRFGDSWITKPDFHIALLTDPVTLASRSHEEIPCSMKKIQMYSMTLHNNPTDRIIKIDSGRPVEDILDEIVPGLVKALSTR